MAPEIDIEKLFETHTVEEVKGELNKIRNVIEKKKEDLRVMVGERYRDLIEAADTIQQMETSAAGVCTEVAAVQHLCSSLQHRGLIGFKTSPREKNKCDTGEGGLLSVSSQVRLVVLSSTRVWSLLERGDILPATQLYLLTQHTHTSLMLLQAASEVDVTVCFPVLGRQWASVCQLPATITRLCQHTITTPRHQRHTQRVCGAVVSLLLLQGCSLSGALHAVLERLRDALLTPLQRYTPAQTARPLVTAFAEQLVSALTMLYDVFAPDLSSGSMQHSAVERVLEGVAGDGASAVGPPSVFLLGESAAFLELLPQAVRSYRPNVHGGEAASLRLQRGELEAAVGAWLRGLEGEARQHITAILSHCPSVQSVCVVRESVWRVLDARPRHRWQQMVGGLGVGEWCVWRCVVRACVQQRARHVVTQLLTRAVRDTLQHVTRLTDSIRDSDRVRAEEGSGVSAFVWSEAADDLPEQVGWLGAAQRTLQQSGGLAYKSRGFTPRTQAVCRALDAQLQALRTDLSHMQCGDTEERPGAREDYEELLRLLQETAGEAFSRLINDMTGLAEKHADAVRDDVTVEGSPPDTPGTVVVDPDEWCPWDSYIDGSSSDGELLNSDPSVLSLETSGSDVAASLSAHQTVLLTLARLCQAMASICPNLQLCATATALVSSDTVRRVFLGLSVDAPGSSSSPAVWSSLLQQLDRGCEQLLQQHLDALTAALTRTLHRRLLRPLQRDHRMAMLTAVAMCDTVEVCEGVGETGGAVVSRLRVPAQPSPALHHALLQLCAGLSAATLHTMPRSFSSTVPGCVCRSVATAYRPIVAAATAAPNQQLALHLLFDVRWLAAVMLPPGEQHKPSGALLSSLQQQLEACVDPFDLSVFQPHLSARVRAAANRTQVLLGAVFVRERQHPVVQASTAAGPALLPLVPVVDVPRFSNVPLPRTGPLVQDSGGPQPGPATAAVITATTPPQQTDKVPTAAPPSLAGSRSATTLFSWFGGSVGR